MKKVLMIMLALFLVMQVWGYTIRVEYTYTTSSNSPSQNNDGSWKTNSGGSINFDNGEDPKDPKSYEGKGGIPTTSTKHTGYKNIEIEGLEPTAIEIKIIEEAVLNDIKENINNIENNTSDINQKDETAKIEISATYEHQENVEKERKLLFNTDISLPLGDPVLLSTGQYLFEEEDLHIQVNGFDFTLSRLYQSEKNVAGVMQNKWYHSIDTRIIRGLKYEPVKERDLLKTLWLQSLKIIPNTKKKIRKLTRSIEKQIRFCEEQISELDRQLQKLNSLLYDSSLTRSGLNTVKSYIATTNQYIIEYNQKLQNIIKERDVTVLPVKRLELEEQKRLTAIQKERWDHAKRELVHYNANVDYNTYSARGVGFTDTISCGNDVLLLFDTKGRAFSYKLVENPHYNRSKNHYPNGSETVNLIPGDNKKLVLLPNGSMEWIQEDGSVWLYNEYGILTKITSVHNVSLDFNYDTDFYLQSISAEGIVLYHFYWTNGALTKIENARDRSETVEYSYNSSGLLSSVKDTDGDVVRYEIAMEIISQE